MMPFYSKVPEEQSWELCLQFTAVLVLFTLATLLAKPILNWIGPRTLSLVSLVLGAVGCILIGNVTKLRTEIMPDSKIAEKLETVIL